MRIVISENQDARTGESAPALPARRGFAHLLTLAPWALGGAVATAMVSAAAGVAVFWVIYRIVEHLLTGGEGAAVWPLVGWAAVLLVVKWALMAGSHVLAHRGAFAIQHRLRLAVARRLGEVPLSFFSGRGSGSLRRTLTDDVNSLEGFFAHMLPDAVAAATVPIVALALLFVADWRLALAALAPLPLALFAQWWFMRRSAERMQEWNALQGRIANEVGEFIRGVHVVKSFGLDARRFGQLAAAVRGAAEWVGRHARESAAGWVLFVGLLTANLIVVAPLGAWLYLRQSLPLATYVLFLLVAPIVLAPLLRLTFAMGEQMQRAQALERIDDVLAAPTLVEPSQAQTPSGPMDVCFADVGHCYGKRRALDAVSVTARAGQVTALVGASGSGKSTLIRLVARLYECDGGSVRVGGVDVRDWRLDDLLGKLGIVFQEVVLFHGTVRENLRMARVDASDAQIEAAARAARVHDVIQGLPRGYDTPLGEGGARLSGGERQRLSIARALLKDAPILLLDEATASVDADNEAAIQRALNDLCRDRTVLMVAHRLRTVMHADHLVVLEAGRVVGQGTHDALLDTCAAYRRLWEDSERARDWSLGRTHGEHA